MAKLIRDTFFAAVTEGPEGISISNSSSMRATLPTSSASASVSGGAVITPRRPQQGRNHSSSSSSSSADRATTPATLPATPRATTASGKEGMSLSLSVSSTHTKETETETSTNRVGTVLGHPSAAATHSRENQAAAEVSVTPSRQKGGTGTLGEDNFCLDDSDDDDGYFYGVGNVYDNDIQPMQSPSTSGSQPLVDAAAAAAAAAGTSRFRVTSEGDESETNSKRTLSSTIAPADDVDESGSAHKIHRTEHADC